MIYRILIQPLIFLSCIYFYFFQNFANAIDIKKWQTNDGMEVYYVKTQGLPIVDISLNFKSGSIDNPKTKAGIAEFTQELLITGNQNYSEEAVAKLLADNGAQLSGNVNKDFTNFSLRVIYEQEILNNVTDLWINLLTKPKFSAKILNREIKRAVAAYRESLTEPSTVAYQEFIKAIYPNHPYGFLADDKSYQQIKTDDLRTFYQQHYHPENAIIAFVGEISFDEAKQISNKISVELTKSNAKVKFSANKYDDPKSTKHLVINKEFDSKQTHIYLGMPFIKRGDPDFFPLLVGNYILGGGGFASRLVEIIREENGLAYSVYSTFSLHKFRGAFEINMQTQAKNTENALELIYSTIDDFIANGITPDELEKAKSFLQGSFPLRLDSNAKMIRLVAMVGIYNLPLDYLNNWVDKIAKVTADDIKSAFMRNFDKEQMVVVIVGPK